VEALERFLAQMPKAFLDLALAADELELSPQPGEGRRGRLRSA
jgi:hypothetical protein